jgi:hypothetical protein
MFKIIGGVIVGVFVGTMVMEILRRRRPEMVIAIEKKAKQMTDKLFEGLREGYDFREGDQV